MQKKSEDSTNLIRRYCNRIIWIAAVIQTSVLMLLAIAVLAVYYT